MNKKTLMIIICLLFAAILFTGCTENLKQDAIAGNYENKTVTSNGGSAVTYGNYLYFINGAAGEDADNTFGKVVKGAIMRVELDENKVPKIKTLVTIVPKKVYYTDATYGGIYIINDYIYYSTTGIKKDSQGNPKTAEMVVMRTKVDGTGSEVIAEFDSHSTPYKIVDNSMVYIQETNIYRVNLLDKKFKAEKIEEGIDSTHFFTETNKKSNSMDNYLIYSVTDKDTSQKTYKAVSIDGKDKKEILKSQMIGEDATYSATILDIVYLGQDKLTVFYNITDDKPNTPYAGIYSYTYDRNFTFEKSALIKFTQNPSSTSGFDYKEFHYVENKVLAVGTTKDSADKSVSKIDLYTMEGAYINNVDVFNSAITIFDLYLKETDQEKAYYLYYTADNKFYNIKLTIVDNQGQLSNADADAILYYDGAFGTQGVSAEIINDVLYFMNGSIANNIYYLELSKVKERDADSRKPSALGIITDEDRIAAF